jgi:hypothetical protein
MKAKRVDKHGKGIKCAICNKGQLFGDEYVKICLNCYFKHDEKLPKHIPEEQHDLWIINYLEKQQKGTAQ